tara:strand:+ start:3119 stop:8179 length:5061 start_codon:yes stop_codon:yes gene_type:complete
MAEQLDNTTEEDEQLIKVEDQQIVPDTSVDSKQLELSGPAKEAGFTFAQQQKAIDEDIEKRQQKAFVPSLNQVLLEGAEPPKNINKQTVDKAKLYVESLSSENKELPPVLKNNLFNAYKMLKQDLESAEQTAQADVPKYRAFGVTAEGEVAPEYANKNFFGVKPTFFGMLKTPERRLAENRARLVQFGERTKIAERSPEAFSILTESFTTGDTFRQFLNDSKDIISGGLTLQKIIRNLTGDYVESLGRAFNESKDGEEGVFDLASQYFKEKANARRVDVENYMNGFQDSAIAATSTDRINTFIKDEYIKKFGEEEYKKNSKKLMLDERDARAIYNFASAELTFIENYIKDLGFNLGTRVGFATIGKAMGQVIGTKSPVKFLLDQDRKRKTYPKNADGINPYSSTSTVKFTEMEANQIKRDGFFKFLLGKLSFKTTRQTLKAQQGQYIYDDIIKNMDPKYQNAIDDAIKKVNDATTTAARNQALSELDIAENAFLKASTSGFSMIKGNRYAMPVTQLQDILGDELLPTLAQSFTFNALTSGEVTAEQLERANLLSAIMYLSPAVLQYPFRWIVAGGEKFIPTGADLSFQIKSVLDGTGLTRAVGLKPLLDPDVMDVKIPNAFGELRSPDVEQYRAGKVFKNLFVRLDDDTQKLQLKNAEDANRDIDTALSVVRDSPTVDQYRNYLRLSYAQLSSISWYHGVAKGLLSKLTLRDVMSTSSRFNTAVKAMREADQLLVAHSNVLDDMKSAFINAARNNKLTGEGSEALRNILELESNINVAFAGAMQENKQQAALVEQEISSMLSDPKHFLSLDPAQLDEVLDSRLANVDLGDPTVARGIEYESDFFDKNMDTVLNMHTIHKEALKGLANSTELLSTKQGEIPNYNVLRKSVKSHYGIIDNYYRNIAKQIYEPLDSFGTVEASDVYKSLLELHKKASFEDIGINDVLLTNFRPKSEFNKTARGKEFTKVMNDIASEAIKRTFVNTFGDAAPIYYLEWIESSKNIVGKAYGFPFNKSTGEVKFDPAPIHYYDYIMSRGGMINDQSLSEVQIKFADLVYLKRELTEKAVNFKKSDKSTIKEKAREYSELSDSIESLMKEKGSELEVVVNGMQSNAYKEVQKMNILYGALVGKRKEKDSLLRQLEIINGREYDADAKKKAFNILTGKNLFDNMMEQTDFDAKLGYMDDFRTTIEEAYGVPVLPKALTKDISSDDATDNIGYFAGNRVLRDDIDFSATVPGEVYTYRDLLERSVTYMLDPKTKIGQAGIELADMSVAMTFKYMSFHKDLKDNLGKLLQSKKIYQQEGDLFYSDALDTSSSFGGQSFLSDPDNGVAYKEALQEALSFNTTDGVKYLSSVDRYMLQTEADLGHFLKKSEKARKIVRDQADKLYRAAKQDRATAERTFSETSELVNKTILNFNLAEPEDFIKRYGIGSGLRNTVDGIDQEYMQRFINDIELLQVESPNTSLETIKMVYTSMLFNGLMERAGMKSVTVERLPEQMLPGQSAKTQIRVLQNPAEVLELMQHPNVRSYFKYLGIDDEHFDGLKSIMSMIAREKSYRDNTMSPAIYRNDYTDANVLSRAFNWFRGMVGTEFLLADAGFRMLRDNEQQLFQFLLSDKENTKFTLAIAQNTRRPSPAEVSQFVARLEAYLIRNLLVSYDYDEDKREQLGAISDVLNPTQEEFMDLNSITGTN